jgi:hypothetical protein
MARERQVQPKRCFSPDSHIYLSSDHTFMAIGGFVSSTAVGRGAVETIFKSGALRGILGHGSPASYSLVKERLLQVTGALRARVTIGATFFRQTALACGECGKNYFAQTVFAFWRAAQRDAKGVARLTHRAV